MPRVSPTPHSLSATDPDSRWLSLIVQSGGYRFYRYEALYVPHDKGFQTVHVFKLADQFDPVEAPFDRGNPDYTIAPYDFTTDPGESGYTARYVHTGAKRCQGFDYRQTCKHIQTVSALHRMAEDFIWYTDNQASDAPATVPVVAEQRVLSGALQNALRTLRRRSNG